MGKTSIFKYQWKNPERCYNIFLKGIREIINNAIFLKEKNTDDEIENKYMEFLPLDRQRGCTFTLTEEKYC